MEIVQLQRWSGEGANRKFDWETESVVNAMKLIGPFRCPECNTPVRLHKASADGSNPAHGEHRIGSTICSLSHYFGRGRKKTCGPISRVIDQPVLEKWWAQLDYSVRMGVLYFSDMDELKLAAGITAQQNSYSSFRIEIREVIEKAFLEGREGERFWFGIEWLFACPLCKEGSREKGRILFQSGNTRTLEEFLYQQGATCMNCNHPMPIGTDIHIQLLKAPIAVLTELGFVDPGAKYPVETYFSDAWRTGVDISNNSLQDGCAG